MEQILYSLFDLKSRLFRFPRFYRTAGDAIRACSLAVTDEKTELGQFPKDFELYEHCKFNDETGKMEVLESPKFICNINDLKVVNNG